MKLHAFDLSVNGKRIRGFTRDRAGTKLKVPMEIDGVQVSPYAWKYSRIFRFTKGQTLAIDQILRSVGLHGFAVRELPPLPTKFFVFEMKLDAAEIKIFSEDRNLTALKQRLNQLRLGTKGEAYFGEKEDFIGEVEIRSQREAESMGISDYDKLIHYGYYVAVTRVATKEEFWGKNLERHLNKESKKRGWGIIVQDVQLDFKIQDAPKKSPAMRVDAAPVATTTDRHIEANSTSAKTDQETDSATKAADRNPSCK